MRASWLAVLVACTGDDEGVKDGAGCPDPILGYVDDDGDGFGVEASAEEFCGTVPADRVETFGDCDDADPGVNPGAAETCDGADEDCDDELDEGLPSTPWFADEDGDGFGDPAAGVNACAAPAGHVADDQDCDDADPLVNPGETEVCNGVDDDCDDLLDDADGTLDLSTRTNWYVDDDGDGYGLAGGFQARCEGPPGAADNDDDCDDADALVNPGATEICGGGDEDCDGLVDDTDASLDTSTAFTWYLDGDGDGYGATAPTAVRCVAPGSYVDNPDDCDDSDPTVRVPVDWSVDGDGDGVGDGVIVSYGCFPPYPGTASAFFGVDCDDVDPLRFPGNPEVCEDGIDNDCSVSTGDSCLLFGDNFEDGDYAGWSAPASGQTPSIDAIGANGTAFSFRMDGGGIGHYNGIYWTFSPAIQPSEIRWYARTSTVTGDRGYVVFGGPAINNGNTAAFCWFSGAVFQCYDGSSYYSTPLVVNTWHEIRLPIDWVAERFDLVVDGTTVGSGIPFRGTTGSLAEFHLYNYSGPTAWWDEIEMLP